MNSRQHAERRMDALPPPRGRARVPIKPQRADTHVVKESLLLDDLSLRLPLLSDTVMARSERVDCEMPHTKHRLEARCSNNDPSMGAVSSASKRKHRHGREKRIAPRLSSTAMVESASHLSALDERVLILYQSSLRYGKQLQDHHETVNSESRPTSFGPEATYAAVSIQRIIRGKYTRERLAAFNGPKNQRAATMIQMSYRWAVTQRRIAHRLQEALRQSAIRIQAWYRGCSARELVLDQRALVLNRHMTSFQRRFRGLRFWRIVKALLHQRRSDAAQDVQRLFRGWKARREATAIRNERNRIAEDFKANMELHRRYARCEGCSAEKCTEKSLLRCFMTRFIGLQDYAGAKFLGEQGIRQYPSSALFVLLFSVLLQAICEDLEISMAYLSRANTIGLQKDELNECESQFFQAALMLRPNDAAIHLDIAIFYQSCGRTNHAESHYEKALNEPPCDYAIPGYLHRLQTVDRLLMNYHRFCSVLNFHETTVLIKEVRVAKKARKVSLRVVKASHFTMIGPAEPHDSNLFNTLYLTDEELVLLLDTGSGLITKGSASQVGSDSAKRLLTLSEWRSKNLRAPIRQSSGQVLTRSQAKRPAPLGTSLTQMYQDKLLGLSMHPSKLARYSMTRSKLRLSKEMAEALLKQIVFIDPSASEPAMESSSNSIDEPIRDEQLRSLHRILVIPRVLRLRQERYHAFLTSYAAIAVQSLFRGFRFRAEVRRERLLHAIHQRQVDDVFAKLHENHMRREKRRKSAVVIQRVFKGIMQRHQVAVWRVQAVQIQRVFRGYRGRKRAIAFREGNCTFYMAERVYQRGLEVSGHFLMLSIDKCGLSFRLDGFDIEQCTGYHGFLSHQTSMGLLCYTNWTYAKSLCGRELQLHGEHIQITDVASIDPDTGECFVSIAKTDDLSTSSSVTLADCIQAINLRNLSKNETMLPLPVKTDDTTRIVEAIVARLILVPAIRMATHELRRKNDGQMIIALAPPSTMHYTFLRRRRAEPLDGPRQQAGFNHAGHTDYPTLTVFPVVNGMRGVSVGKTHFRKKCSRHAVTYTRCRCVLPFVTTAAYIDSLSTAMTPPPPPTKAQVGEEE